jgi:hypothetical protein
MVEIPILKWIAKPLWAGVRVIWDRLRIKDGTLVSLTTCAEGKGVPEALFIGLAGSDQTCLLQIPLIVTNLGRVPVRNLAIRVQLPKALTPDSLPLAPHPTIKESYHRVESDTLTIQDEYRLSDLRIGEAIALPILLRVRSTDWITVKLGGAESPPGFTKFGTRASTRLVGLRLIMAAYADNARAVVRNLDVWITPAESIADLQQKTKPLAEVQYIWRYGASAFRFPLIGSLVFYPRLPWRDQMVSVIHVASDHVVREPEVARLFDLALADGFVPVRLGRHILANPGPNKAKFKKWLKGIYETRPRFYR